MMQFTNKVGGGGAVDFSKFDPMAMWSLFPQAQMGRDYRQAAEEFGAGGLGSSSMLLNKLADVTALTEEDFTNRMFQNWLAAQESAKQRGLEAGIVNARMPLEAASTMGNLASQMYGLQMQPWNTAYQNWYQTTPEGSLGTYGNVLLDLFKSAPGQPQTYLPGAGAGLAGIGSALLPFVGTSRISPTSVPPARNFGPIYRSAPATFEEGPTWPQ